MIVTTWTSRVSSWAYTVVERGRRLPYGRSTLPTWKPISTTNLPARPKDCARSSAAPSPGIADATSAPPRPHELSQPRLRELPRRGHPRRRRLYLVSEVLRRRLRFRQLPGQHDELRESLHATTRHLPAAPLRLEFSVRDVLDLFDIGPLREQPEVSAEGEQGGEFVVQLEPNAAR